MNPPPLAPRLASALGVLFAVTAAGAAPRRTAHAPAPHVLTSTERPAPHDQAKALGDAISGVAERVGPVVVQVEVTARDPGAAQGALHAGDSAFARVLGSGVILTADGAVLTNNHVVEQALSVDVRLGDGRIFAASVVGRDPATDLAVVRIAAANLPVAAFADSDAARVGQWVVAIGSPFGLGHTVTTGVVSATGRGGLGANAVEDYLQTDASINPGNSGGPLVDLDGKVLGINTMVVGRGTGIGFAVPSNMARRVAAQLIGKGRVERAWLGVGVQDVTPDLATELHVGAGDGALINAVAADGPGARANLKAGDVLMALGGRPVRGAQDLMRDVLARDVGAPLRFDVLRAGKRYSTDVTLTARAEPPPAPVPAQLGATHAPGLGLTLRDLPTPGPSTPPAPGARPATVCQVAAVALGSPADRAGLLAGDVVVEADGKPDPSAAAVQQAGADGHLLLRVRRAGAYLYVALRS